ncbi:MAG: class I SAM-dependent methyltransferase [Acidobacteriota bacterium]|nr:class I SAM-dependent methyltransferase [Acidobacteriota bacterium]
MSRRLRWWSSPQVEMRALAHEAGERHLQLLEHAAADLAPDDPALEDWFEQYRRGHQQRLALDLRLLEEHAAPGARVLEVGAVPLLLTAALAAQEYRVHALDVAPQRFAGAIERLGLDVLRCDVETEPMPFPDDSFDVVLFNEIFEHLRIDPIFTLEEVLRVLAPGGRLLLSTPNLRSLRGLRNLLLRNQGHAVSPGGYSQYEKLRSLGHMGHVREYTTREVWDFLTRVGFRCQTLLFRGGYGRGPVGAVEWLLPFLRPFFTVVAVKPGAPAGGEA